MSDRGSIRVGIVGLGKIALDEHVPAIERTAEIELVAVASRNASLGHLPSYSDIDTMILNEPRLDAVVLCQPPGARFDAAMKAIHAGKHVFLEKPPGSTLSEVEYLIKMAKKQNVSLFASWHSRWARGVSAFESWCERSPPRRIRINWKEDVRKWHPGQRWVWEAGGFGVFDPGINALSILTRVVSDPIFVKSSVLAIPANKSTPIAASIALETASGTPIDVELDWRQAESDVWEIIAESDAGPYHFSQNHDNYGDNGDIDSDISGEYCAMYSHFASLVKRSETDADTRPLKLVLDCFMRGKFQQTAKFYE